MFGVSRAQAIGQSAKISFGGEQAAGGGSGFPERFLIVQFMCSELFEPPFDTSKLSPVKMMFKHANHGLDVPGNPA